jgi:hypothetical protein
VSTLLVIETGEGIVGANSWASLAEADQAALLCLYPGKWLPTLDIATKEKALIEAARLLSTCVSWQYPPLTSTQGLAVPLAASAVDCYGTPVSVPTQLAVVKQDQMSLARHVLEGNPMSPPSYGSATGAGVVISESSSVGSLSTSKTYSEGSAVPVVPVAAYQITALRSYCLAAPLPVATGSRARTVERTY